MNNPFDDGPVVEGMEAFLLFYQECYRNGQPPTGELLRRINDARERFQELIDWYGDDDDDT